jgi:hypothetical protein
MNQSGAGIKNCTKPPLGIRPGLKVDSHDYKKIKHSVLLYIHNYQIFKYIIIIIYNCGSQIL